MRRTYPIILSPQQDGAYLVTVPDLPTCVTSGSGIEDAFNMAQDALSACLLALEDESIPLPKATTIQDVKTQEDELVMLLPVDTLSYRMAKDTRAVRKNVSIPAWMAAMVERRNINCSQVLQDALRSMLETPAAAS
jgi:antitoxin HicB